MGVCVCERGPGALRISSRLSPFLMLVMTALVRSDSFTVKEYTDTRTQTRCLCWHVNGILLSLHRHGCLHVFMWPSGCLIRHCMTKKCKGNSDCVGELINRADVILEPWRVSEITSPGL